ncbi:bifunctional methylenetetrahydrofolate dehydrogenase/methenyltetrahydrofolate cyclohydrolase FolD [Bradymonas sediminis]|uniref:Bifunctional protein FolD n=1 Tax=Bradymonas sediminis TaxID=1548548 RepID=A0A2Z4FK64_9DELT|nr:bifunctional methylenetetrahydrofolate dehydrogenase/methenyltetrahydrofolate cyclohydrolase FolD [Bradymonas sediminis]AWV89342.1 bifunctional methylenetetrahydrofolate dehydrogenase/methenyltetrahydrofolate cyclohydrolase FolD [Bradymonas sediminis]TDP73518.1 methylenetetrahydrofolate dehydrogenase (NADP+)/methenyltetrahydrofolate cyclohydrolase [Bradymonas sediminis]
MSAFEPHFKAAITPLRQAASSAAPKLLDGKKIANALLAQIKDATQLLAEREVRAHLCVVRVGDDPASEIYVRHKIRACKKVGIESSHLHLPADISQQELLAELRRVNADPAVNGVLLQLPLSAHHDSEEAIMTVAPHKDVDGFHPNNLGRLMSGQANLEPCTPRGIMTLLAASGVDCAGKQAVVVGRSMIVGRPMAQMLVRANATVTVCHRFTENLADIVQRADILVVATGVAELIKGAWVKPGAVVIDVGISRMADGSLQGDVEFEVARERASLITPVPGGVGPMTVATLMENTLHATLAAHHLVIRGGEICDKTR